MWSAITNGKPSTRVEIVHAVSNDADYFCILYDGMKYFSGFNTGSAGEVTFVFESDLDPSSSHESCSTSTPLLLGPSMFGSTVLPSAVMDSVFLWRVGQIAALSGLLGMVGLILVVKSYIYSIKGAGDEHMNNKSHQSYGAVDM